MPEQLLFGNTHCKPELIVLVEASWSIPWLVEARDSHTEVGVYMIVRFISYFNSVVQGINFEDKVLVELLVYLIQLALTVGGFRPDFLEDSAENLPAKVLIDESRAAKLNLEWLSFNDRLVLVLMPSHVERALVVIETVLGWVKHASDISHDV